MELKLEGSQLDQMIQAAVMQALGDVGKEALMKEVVRYLTQPDRERTYGGQQPASPLTHALRNAAGVAAMRHFTKLLEEDKDFVNQLEALYTDAVKKYLGQENREKIVDAMANRLSEAFKERY